jgi:hypothetical protein
LNVEKNKRVLLTNQRSIHNITTTYRRL